MEHWLNWKTYCLFHCINERIKMDRYMCIQMLTNEEIRNAFSVLTPDFDMNRNEKYAAYDCFRCEGYYNQFAFWKCIRCQYYLTIKSDQFVQIGLNVFQDHLKYCCDKMSSGELKITTYFDFEKNKKTTQIEKWSGSI